jgi:competence ComEA-like helix-hairpin-helix protein
MSFFRPREVRAILVLSILVFIGSTLTLLKRQGKLSNLDLDIFLNNDRYNYTYKVAELPQGNDSDYVENADPGPGESGDTTQDNRIIDLNQAGYFDLQTLPGVGPVLAERIIAYRDSVGTFHSAGELVNVKGIGEAKYAAMKDRITVK